MFFLCLSESERSMFSLNYWFWSVVYGYTSHLYEIVKLCYNLYPYRKPLCCIIQLPHHSGLLVTCLGLNHPRVLVLLINKRGKNFHCCARRGWLCVFYFIYFLMQWSMPMAFSPIIFPISIKLNLGQIVINNSTHT